MAAELTGSSSNEETLDGILILMTDTVDLSARMEEDEEVASEMFQEEMERISSICERLEGRVLKSTESGLLLAFRKPLDAVYCCLEVQREQDGEGEGVEVVDEDAPEPLNHRIGMHLGEIDGSKNELSEEKMTLLNRIKAAADPGGVSLSGEAYNVLRQEPTLPPSVFDEENVEMNGDLLVVHHLLVRSTRLLRARDEAAMARAEAQREASARKAAEETAASYVKLEQEAVEAQAKAQQEAMDAKMRAVRQSMAREKAEKKIKSEAAAKDRLAKQMKHFRIAAAAIIFILIIVIFWPRGDGPGSEVPSAVEEELENSADKVKGSRDQVVPLQPVQGANEERNPAPATRPPTPPRQPVVERPRTPVREEPKPRPRPREVEVARPRPALREEEPVEEFIQVEIPVEPLIRSGRAPARKGTLKPVLTVAGKVLPPAAAGAVRIEVDGNPASFRDGLVSGLSSGGHRVTINHPDFMPWSGTARVNQNEAVELIANLTPRTAPLFLTVTPAAEYTVLANGREFFVVEGAVNLPTGVPIILEVQASPFKPHRQKMQLKAGWKHRLDVRLRPDVPAISELDEEPRVYRRPNPSYPTKLWKDGTTGSVELQFIVSRLGHVEEAWVMNSAHPDLARACVAAMEEWRFEPGKWGDTLTIFYTSAVFEFPPKSRALWREATLEKGLNSDQGRIKPPKPVETEMPLYPPKQYKWLGGVADLVRVTLTVDQSGNVSDFYVHETVNKSFADEIEVTIPSWRFEPATRQGRPIISKITVPLEFKEL